MLFRTDYTRTSQLSGVLSRALRTFPVISRIASKIKGPNVDVDNGALSDHDLGETVSEGTAEDEEEDISRFDQVCESLDFEKVPAYATTIRSSHTKGKMSDSRDATIAPELDIDCDLEGPPLYGSFHILFPLEFKDGVRWILKVPAAGYQGSWDAHAANALRSEALTMRKLSTETSIPVPAVYSFDTSLDNELKCPFILMEYMNGTPLWYGWFNDDSDSLEAFRTRALESLAAAVVQLKPYTSSKAGTPCFDDDGNITDIATTRVYDRSTMYNRLGQAECDDEPPAYCTLGPFTDMRDQLLYLLNRQRQGSTMRHGIYEMCRMFIRWLPQDDVSGDGRFVLTHPDLDLQNVLVAEDGTLQGLIDWDGATTSSVLLGCQSYPLWLTHDWTSQMYNYDPETGKPKNEFYPRENTPEELLYYRNMYCQFMEEKLREKVFNDSEQPTFRPSSTTASAATRKSLIVAGLDAAANDPMCMWNVVEIIFDQISRLTAPKWEKLIREEEEEWKDYADDGSSETDAPEMEDVSPNAQPAEDEGSSSARCSNDLPMVNCQNRTAIDVPPMAPVGEAHLSDRNECVDVSSEAEAYHDDAGCNQNHSGEDTHAHSVQASDEAAVKENAYDPSLPTNRCNEGCNASFCLTHGNLKAPSRLLQISDHVRSAVDRLPSQEAQNKRKWFKFPSLVCNASNRLRSLADHLPQKNTQDRGYLHLPDTLSAVSDRLQNVTEKFYHDGEKNRPIQESKPCLRTSRFAGLQGLVNGPSMLSCISEELRKAADLLHAKEISHNSSKDVCPREEDSGDKNFSWLDVAQEMERHGITPADIYQHCDSIAALIKDLAEQKSTSVNNEGVPKSSSNDIPSQAGVTSSSTEQDTGLHQARPDENAAQEGKSDPVGAGKAASKEISPAQHNAQEDNNDRATMKAETKGKGLPNDQESTTNSKEDEDEDYVSYKKLDYWFDSGTVALGLMNGDLHPLQRQRLQEGFNMLWTIT